MANKDGHRRFGNARQRGLGRWQARYPGPDCSMRSTLNAFASKRDAGQWLTVTAASMLRVIVEGPTKSAAGVRTVARPRPGPTLGSRCTGWGTGTREPR